MLKWSSLFIILGEAKIISEISLLLELEVAVRCLIHARVTPFTGGGEKLAYQKIANVLDKLENLHGYKFDIVPSYNEFISLLP